METVKVEIQKLQLLNDRIAQTIDALNQLRMSVHGIQHTSVSPYGFGSPFTPYATPYPTQFVPQVGAFGQYGTQFGPQFAPQFPVGSPFGIQHSPTMMGAYGTPFLPQQQFGVPQVTPQYTLPFVGNGISHTALDPTLSTRLTQTWPFTQTLS
jgi:hypothetical protein